MSTEQKNRGGLQDQGSQDSNSQDGNSQDGARTAAASGDVGALVARMRELHRTQQQRDAARARAESGSSDDDDPAVQAGSRAQPENPLPAEHLVKPGNESEMALAPRYTAPDYRGSGKLQDRVAIITGGDSGIGRAVAVLFAREGADVAVFYLDEHEDAEQTAEAVRAEGRRACVVAGDVRDPQWCRAAVAKVVERFGRIDILVNNAAFQLHAHDLDELDPERVELTLSTNIGGYMNMARAVIPSLPRDGSIINTGSVVGFRGSANLLDYAASKGAIHAFTKSLASNLLPRGIRVNAVAPGPVWTPLNPADRPPDEIPEFGAHSDMGRVAQPEEIAPAYVFLAAPSCSAYISGIVLPITGSIGAY
jgi:NAD(P)-dependent dehydrogenase (short-subunit alcohol dehydrogenase family)